MGHLVQSEIAGLMSVSTISAQTASPSLNELVNHRCYSCVFDTQS